MELRLNKQITVSVLNYTKKCILHITITILGQKLPFEFVFNICMKQTMFDKIQRN